MALGSDLSRAWASPGVTAETRKKIVRLLISEITVDVSDSAIVAGIHWQGGGHTHWCAFSSAAILYGSVFRAKLTPLLRGAQAAGDQASTGSGRMKAGMVRLAK
jgi:hypothetical protein